MFTDERNLAAQARLEEELRGLICEAQAGGSRDRDRLISRCQQLLRDQIDALLRFLDKGGDTVSRDLQHLGNIGLERAIETFDPTVGLSFSLYLSQWVRAYWTRSAYVRDCLPALSFLQDEAQRDGDISRASLPTEANYNLEDLMGVVETATPAEAGPEDRVIAGILEEQLRETLEELPFLQKWVIEESFGLDGDLFCMDESLRSLLGLSVRAYRVIKKKALVNLRRRLSAETLQEGVYLHETSLKGLGDQLFFLGNLIGPGRLSQPMRGLSSIDQLAAGWQNLSRGLERLDEEHRVAVCLCHGFGGVPCRSFFEIQQILDIDAKTCNRVICSASSYLVKAFEGRPADSLQLGLKPILRPDKDFCLKVPLYFQEDLFLAEQFQALEKSASCPWPYSLPTSRGEHPWQEYFGELSLLLATCRKRSIRLGISPHSIDGGRPVGIATRLAAVSDFHSNLQKVVRL